MYCGLLHLPHGCIQRNVKYGAPRWDTFLKTLVGSRTAKSAWTCMELHDQAGVLRWSPLSLYVRMGCVSFKTISSIYWWCPSTGGWGLAIRGLGFEVRGLCRFWHCANQSLLPHKPWVPMWYYSLASSLISRHYTLKQCLDSKCSCLGVKHFSKHFLVPHF